MLRMQYLFPAVLAPSLPPPPPFLRPLLGLTLTAPRWVVCVGLNDCIVCFELKGMGYARMRALPLSHPPDALAVLRGGDTVYALCGESFVFLGEADGQVIREAILGEMGGGGGRGCLIAVSDEEVLLQAGAKATPVHLPLIPAWIHSPFLCIGSFVLL